MSAISKRRLRKSEVQFEATYETPTAAPQSDGAVCDQLRLVRRPPHHLRAQPVRAWPEERRRRATRYRRRQGAGGQFLCRWRLRFQGLDDAAHRDHRESRPRAEASGQAGRHPRAGIQHRDLSCRDPAQDQDRRQQQRQAHRAPPRGLGGVLARRPLRGRRHQHHDALYDCSNVESLVSIVRADRNTPGFMRSPPEVPYMFALESALDEVALSAPHGPDRAASRQRHHEGADWRQALYLALADGLLRRRRQSLRLGRVARANRNRWQTATG